MTTLAGCARPIPFFKPLPLQTSTHKYEFAKCLQTFYLVFQCLRLALRAISPRFSALPLRHTAPLTGLGHRILRSSEGVMIWLETLIELKLFNSSFRAYPFIIEFKSDKQLPVEQFEAIASQSTVPSPHLQCERPLCSSRDRQARSNGVRRETKEEI